MRLLGRDTRGAGRKTLAETPLFSPNAGKNQRKLAGTLFFSYKMWYNRVSILPKEAAIMQLPGWFRALLVLVLLALCVETCWFTVEKHQLANTRR